MMHISIYRNGQFAGYMRAGAYGFTLGASVGSKAPWHHISDELEQFDTFGED